MMVFYPRGRQPYSYIAPVRREMDMYGPPGGMGYPVHPPPTVRPYPFRGASPYGQPYLEQWGQRQTPFPRERQGRGAGMNNVMDHMNTISSGLNMLNQIGSIMSIFRGL